MEKNMKRLALLVATAFIAFLLSACGDKSEKKVETKATNEMEQSKSQLNDANKEVNSELKSSEPAPAPAPAAPAPAPSASAAPDHQDATVASADTDAPAPAPASPDQAAPAAPADATPAAPAAPADSEQKPAQ
jgi:flagellum-specific peptidoglycan hydrolase FlgJ